MAKISAIQITAVHDMATNMSVWSLADKKTQAGLLMAVPDHIHHAIHVKKLFSCLECLMLIIIVASRLGFVWDWIIHQLKTINHFQFTRLQLFATGSCQHGFDTNMS